MTENHHQDTQLLSESEFEQPEPVDGVPVDTSIIQTTDQNDPFHSSRIAIQSRPSAYHPINKSISILSDRFDTGYGSKSKDTTSGVEWIDITAFPAKKMTALKANLPEDMRISKLLRRLCVEPDPDEAIMLCGKLIKSIRDPSNENYVTISFDILTDTLYGAMKKRPDDVLGEMAIVFGTIGYVAKKSFHSYQKYLMKIIKNGSVMLSMAALKRTIQLDLHGADLYMFSDSFMTILKDNLERAEESKEVLFITDIIQLCCVKYPMAFQPCFTDIVDILIGWLLETVESKDKFSHALQSFHQCWAIYDKFARDLLSQFIEDILVFGDDFEQLDRTDTDNGTFGSYVNAYNTVVKCVWHDRDSLMEKHLNGDFRKIYNIATMIWSKQSPDMEALLSINELISIDLTCHSMRDDNFDVIYGLITYEWQNILKFNDLQIISLIYATINLIRQKKVTLPIEFVRNCLHSDTTLKVLVEMKNKKVKRGILKVYHEILFIKNVPILQEAYKWILNDIGRAVKLLFPKFNLSAFIPIPIENGNGIHTRKQAKCLLVSLLTALSSLAVSNASIIAMYALTPSFLSLLIDGLRSNRYLDWKQSYPAIYDGMSRLLNQHCLRNNNFISSSVLLKSCGNISMASVESSPTSQHYSKILIFLRDILIDYTIICRRSSHLLINLLKWVQQIVEQSNQYDLILSEDVNFTEIIRIVCRISIDGRENYLIDKCTLIFNSLLQYNVINPELLTGITEVACNHLCSINDRIRDEYSIILAQLPLNITLKQVNDCSGLRLDRSRKIEQFQRWHFTSDVTSLRSNCFRQYLKAITNDKGCDTIDSIESNLLNLFNDCWYFNDRNTIDEPNELAQLITVDQRSLIGWAQWESAVHCVRNKLKTVMGKPQETFYHIESILKENARIIALKDRAYVKNHSTLLANQKRARILLGFIEYLEKSIYNASMGCAFVLPQSEKQIKSFFRLNSGATMEWFNRIRTAINLVAIHCMEPDIVIRNSELVIKHLVGLGKTKEPLFEHTLMSFAWALLKNGESDALQGLYVWIKIVTNQKYGWIKMSAEQAAGHYEIAVAGYKNLLNAPESTGLDAHIRDFITDQIVICHSFLNEWQPLSDFLLQERELNVPRTTTPAYTINLKQLEAFIDFSKSEDRSMLDLSDWNLLDGPDSGSIDNNFSCHRIISLVENSITRMALSRTVDSKLANCCQKIVSGCLQECLRTKSTEQINNLTILNHICHRFIKFQPSESHFGNDSLLIDSNYGSVAQMSLLNWTNYIYDRNDSVKQTDYLDLCLNVASAARNEGNLLLCKNILSKFWQKSHYLPIQSEQPFDLHEMCDRFINQSNHNDNFSDNMLRGLYEISKWLYCFPDKRQIAIQFGIQTISVPQSDSLKSHATVSKMLLTLSEWIQTEGEKSLISPTNQLKQFIDSIDEISPSNGLIPPIDVAVGKLIKYSTVKCPNLSKAWSALGNWCYRWGRKIIESIETKRLRTVIDGRDVQTEFERFFVTDFIRSDIDQIVDILNTNHLSDTNGEDMESGDSVESIEVIKLKLEECPCLSDRPIGLIENLIKIWTRSQYVLFNYYEISADAYFKYLQLTTDSDTNNYECSIVTATLRLLRLVVKHSKGLQTVLDNGLIQTPPNPWKMIIPQLFSRLNHHEPYVRKCVSELLLRVASDSPHLIIFPTVVGAANQSNPSLSVVGTSNSTDPSTTMISCFQTLLDSLSDGCSRDTINQVKVLVKELKRITLLWDELWLVTLTQVYVDSAKRYTAFDAELKMMSESMRLEKLPLLIEKHRIVMRPVIFVLEQLFNLTGSTVETNNERQFQEKFLYIIKQCLTVCQKPFNLSAPNEQWQKFKGLYLTFQQRAQKRSAYSLRMLDISPILAGMENTLISMPGVHLEHNNVVYIRSVDNTVQILPTKTKPKKLAFHGNDGRRYTYLFKGLEDLHLDERIMQFLSIANTMMAKSIDPNGRISKFSARHYSVIPLGNRSGLISWVDNVTPIFALYKKWQQREVEFTRNKETVTVTRPSELFYSVLTPLLAQVNVKPTQDQRKDWPIDVLKVVLKQLTNETPRDLLAKELWCNSVSATAWRTVIRNYSQSIAVMSVIGYVIGLGDRHLDNILIDLQTGEIVHIDYNVCFEKGKALRVPERVPFRMTPNLEEALGVTGIEGIFRLTCEHVLKALKKGRETLLTLLEAFVYDPLIDWTIGDNCTDTGNGTELFGLGGCDAFNNDCRRDGELKQAKQLLKMEINKDTIAVRFAEVKPAWMAFRNNILLQLNLLRNKLIELSELRVSLKQAEQQRDLLSNQMAIVGEAQSLGSAMGSHPLNTISQRYATYRNIRRHYDELKLKIVRLSMDFRNKSEAYFQLPTTYLSLDLPNVLAQLQMCSTHSNPIYMARECINAIPAPLAPFTDSDNELIERLNTELHDFIIALLPILKNLHEYVPLIQLHPLRIRDRHWFIQCARCCDQMLDTLNGQSMQEFEAQQAQWIWDDFKSAIERFLVDLEVCRRERVVTLEQKQIEWNFILSNHIEKEMEIAKYDFQVQINESDGIGLSHLMITDLVNMYSNLRKVEEDCVAFNDGNLNESWFILPLNDIIFPIIDLLQFYSQPSDPVMRFCKLTADIYLEIRSIYVKFRQQIISIVEEMILSDNSIYRNTVRAIQSFYYDLNVTETLFELNERLNDTIEDNVRTSELLIVVNGISNGFNHLLRYNRNEIVPIIIEFWDLLESLSNNYGNCLVALRKFDLMSKWMEMKEIMDGKRLNRTVFNETSVSIVDAIFQLKRIEMIVRTLEIFDKITFISPNFDYISDDEEILGPLKIYFHQFWRQNLYGLLQFAIPLAIYQITDISNVITVDSISRLEEIPAVWLEQLNDKHTPKNELKLDSSFNRLKLAHTRHINFKRAELAYFLALESGRRIEKHLHLFYSMYDGYLEANGIVEFDQHNLLAGLMENKKIIDWIRNGLYVTLPNLKLQTEQLNLKFIQIIQVAYSESYASTYDLDVISKSFGDGVTVTNNYLSLCSKIGTILCDSFDIITDYYAGKLNVTRPEMISEFKSLSSEWETNCVRMQTSITIITPIEIGIVELLNPDGPIDYQWITNIIGLLDDMTDQIQRTISDIGNRIGVMEKESIGLWQPVRKLIDDNQHLDGSIKSILRSMLTIDMFSNDDRIRQYIKNQKRLYDELERFQNIICGRPFNDRIVRDSIDHLLLFLNDYFDDPIKFETELMVSTVVTLSPFKSVTVDDRYKSKNNKMEQKRNAYAVSVWKRIRMKLEGRDPDQNRRATVQEQVEWMIREAMEPNNLARLYEGWTPWV